MTLSLAIRRISNQLHNKFPDIPLTDYIGQDDEQTKELARNSRRLAALAVEMESGETAPETLVKAITDGANDQGLDAIYLDEKHKELILVQSKWRTDGSGSITSDEISKFTHSVEQIFDSSLDNANNRIKSKQSDILTGLNEFGYTIHAVVITTAKNHINKQNFKIFESLQDRVNDEYKFLYFREINQEDIYDYLAKGVDRKNIDLTIELNNWGYINEPCKVFYGTISAAEVAKWYQEYGNDLFSQNIRSFKESTEVNQGITKTLKEEPENFFLYNNGIKLLCSSTGRTSQHSNNHAITTIKLKNASIVNGAQTTGAIAKFYQDQDNAGHEASVFVEVIDLTGLPESAASTITKLSNTQNRIESKDFAALDPTQARIARDLALEKEQIKYIYKTGEFSSQEPDSPYCTFDEAIPALACEQNDIKLVALAKGNIGALTADIAKPPYKKLFNSGTSAITLYNSVQIMRYVNTELAEIYAKKQGKTRLIALHGNRFILHLILQSIKDDLRKNNSSLAEQILSIEEVHTRVDRVLSEYVRKTQVALSTLYPDAYPAFAFKNQSKCAKIKEVVLSSD